MAKKTIWALQDFAFKVKGYGDVWTPYHHEYDSESEAIQHMELVQQRYKSKRFRVVKRVILSEVVVCESQSK
jgi:hypothetical protein